MAPEPLFTAIRRLMVAGIIAAAPLGTAALASAGAAHPAPIRLDHVATSTTGVAVRGVVALPRGASRELGRVRLTLTTGDGNVEVKLVRLDSHRRFAAAWTTQLVSPVTLRAQLKIAGRKIGPLLTRALTPEGPDSSSQVTGAPGPGGPPALNGTFRLQPGSAPAGQPPTGSWFEMLQANGAPLSNQSSPSANKDYTPLSPGTDGGLRTDAYQEPPSRAFAGGSSGNALADRIIEPVSFYGVNFSIVTAATDAQTGQHDPLPAISNNDGKLSGQLTAWVAQWNGQSFNQGSPKPDGSLPPPSTPLTGGYDESTKRFTLDWRSRIVGGPFNGFTGVWHLAGTFVPAG